MAKPVNRALCEVKPGHVFKFKAIRTANLKLSKDCGYCELGDAWDCVEILDGKEISRNEDEIVRDYGKIKVR